MGDRILSASISLLGIVAALAGIAHAGPTGRVVGKVTVTDADGKPAIADAIVYVVGFPEQAEPNAGPAKIAQKDRKFVPDLVAITVGDSVSFPNGDTFLHNVFSQSGARKFDLGSFKKNDAKTKDFPNPGVVDVYCNIHPEMAATILVLPNRRHTRTTQNGGYVIEGVPAGTWQVFAYVRRATRPTSASVTVVAGQDASVNLAVVRGAEAEHTNKYGEKYHEPTTTYR